MKNSLEIVGGDGRELHALEQRVPAFDLRLRQYAFVESQPAELSIEIQRRIEQALPAAGALGGCASVWPIMTE